MTDQQHPLQYAWSFTYFKKVANKSYEDSTFTLGTTRTVEDFWRLYVHLRRPVDERPTVCDYHVFRDGIKPMWEDENNVNGGKWIVRLKKGVAARYWEDVVRTRPGAPAHAPFPRPLAAPKKNGPSRTTKLPAPPSRPWQLLAMLG